MKIFPRSKLGRLTPIPRNRNTSPYHPMIHRTTRFEKVVEEKDLQRTSQPEGRLQCARNQMRCQVGILRRRLLFPPYLLSPKIR